jgi:pyruvate kinase
MMARIAEAAEASGRHGDHRGTVRWNITHEPDLATAISSAACAIVQVLPVRGIVAFTKSGRTALLVSRGRPTVPIFAFTPEEEVYRRLNLIWGVIPMMVDYVDRLDDLSDRVAERLLYSGHARHGDMVVMTGGHPITSRGVTNFVKVMQIDNQ